MSRILIVLSAVLSLFVSAEDQRPSKPNVILIFIDDMGFGDVGFNGATGPKTPNLDRMAEEGMQFNDFYVACAVCSGSRTALMTGAHYRRLSMAPVLFPNSSAGLHPDEVTIADMLGEAGYATTCIGKWHLGHLPPCLPTYQGFQSYYGIPYSNDMWIDPANKLSEDVKLREGLTLDEVEAGHKKKNWVPLMRNEEVIEYPADQNTLTKRYTEEAIKFIKEKRGGPFFLYLPHTMVHVPLAVSEAFKNRTGQLIWDAIEEVDWSVGEILNALRETGIADRTLVIFTSDNGAAVGSSLPLRAKKGSVYDGGIREPTVMWWPGQIPSGTMCREVTASVDIMPTLAKLCGGKLPERKLDGYDIWPLMSGQEGAKSPHQTYCLMHGPGTVRSGKWKYYPWPEGAERRSRGKPKPAAAETSPEKPKVQLYDTVADISETTNVAAAHPDVVERLQAAWDAHVEELDANRRPTAPLQRPSGSASAGRPGGSPSRPGKPIDWATAKAGQVHSTASAPAVVGKPFGISCSISGKATEGVIVAHGGTGSGYSLYVKNREVVFAVRRTDDSIDRVAAPLGGGETFRIAAALQKGNVLSLQINDSEPVVSTGGGTLLKHPAEDLSIGKDERMPVDPKSPGGDFNGVISSVRIDVAK